MKVHDQDLKMRWFFLGVLIGALVYILTIDYDTSIAYLKYISKRAQLSTLCFYKWLVNSRSSFLTNECTENKVLQLSILKIGLRCAPREGMVNGTQNGSEFYWLQLFNIPGTDLEVHIMEFDRTCGEKLAGIHPSKFIDFHYLGQKGPH